MWTLIVISFIVGNTGQSASGAGTSIASMTFSTQAECNAAVAAVAGDNQVGGAQVKVLANCIRSHK